MQDRIPTPGQEGRVLITPENGSAPFYAKVEMADNPTVNGTPYNKETVLQDATCEILDIPPSAVPNDAFAKLALGIGKYGYVVTVLFPDGSPVEGATLTGINNQYGGTAVTNANGQAVGVSTEQSVVIGVNNPYIDIQSVSGIAIQSTGILTAYTVMLPYDESIKTLTSSQTLNLSPKAATVDFCAVGGGGGGAQAVGNYEKRGPGGGGGYVSNALNVQIGSEDTFSIIVGAGGNVGENSSSSAETFTAAAGGTTSVSKNSSVILSANGGGGATGYYRNGTASGGTGNGNGGVSDEKGADGTGYIFNDQSLGLAGGGGGGGDDSGTLTSGGYSGLPYGAPGSIWSVNTNAGTPGIGGGGGGGAKGSYGEGGYASAGGSGAVYARFHH